MSEERFTHKWNGVNWVPIDEPTPSPRRLENRVASLEQEVKDLRNRVDGHGDAINNHRDYIFRHEQRLDDPTPDQPAADDATLRKTFWDAYSDSLRDPDPERYAAPGAAANAGLDALFAQLVAPRIDPEDAGQIRVVVDTLFYKATGNTTLGEQAALVLTALAAHLDGGGKDD